LCALLVVAIEIAHPLHLERPATFLQFFTGQSGGASEFTLQWGVLSDPLAATVGFAVVLVSLLVQVYAVSFMRREDGVVRFFCALLFATFAMLGVTLSVSYFVMAILLFVAAAAKSALFPLHVWLPSSAQAPAPAAALIHSAGSALCGVYLIARTYALFHASPRGLALLAIAGGISAVLGVLWA